jgi:hypothetical protein
MSQTRRLAASLDPERQYWSIFRSGCGTNPNAIASDSEAI